MKVEIVVASPLENNIYVLGDDKEALIIDAAGDAEDVKKVRSVVNGRKVQAILITHGHFDHIMGKNEFKKYWPSTPIYLNPDDTFLWQQRYPYNKADKELGDRMKFSIGDNELLAIHTPGHTPGSTCLYWQTGQTVFTGDTLFPGGPGATRWEYGDFDLIIKSIKDKLFTLPTDTKVMPGHGKSTTIGTESPKLNDWAARRW